MEHKRYFVKCLSGLTLSIRIEAKGFQCCLVTNILKIMFFCVLKVTHVCHTCFEGYDGQLMIKEFNVLDKPFKF